MSDTATLVSYASLFDRTYTVRARGYEFEETVRPGAFRRSLGQQPNVVFRTEHSSLPLARTTSGTLTLTEDAIGLRYEARLDRSDPDVQALLPKVARGDLTESSMAFRVPHNGDQWNDEHSKRALIECNLSRGDVSLCTFAASPNTGEHTAIRATSATPELRREIAEAMAGELTVTRGHIVSLDGVELRNAVDLQERATLGSAERNDLPDSAFAYIEPGGTKDAEGKTTPRSLRHFPIHDAGHVRAALSRIGQGARFGPQALPKVRAAAKRFGIEVARRSAVLDPNDDDLREAFALLRSRTLDLEALALPVARKSVARTPLAANDTDELRAELAQLAPMAPATPPNLRLATSTSVRCASCRYFDAEKRLNGSCRLYSYPVRTDQVCDSWERQY